ncbi:MAG: OmpA family protein [Ferruginibacter sp.]
MIRLFTLCLLVTALPLLVHSQQTITIHFATDESALKATETKLLDSVIAAYQQAPGLTVELTGHCDYRGSDSYNDALSLKRVKAVAQYLTDKGVPVSIIKKEEGFGEKMPVDTGASADALARNRRVEVTFYKPAPVVTNEPEKTEAPVTLTKKLSDTTLKTGSTLVLQNLHFVGGRHYILQESVPVIQDLLNALKANPTLEIAIEGHVCCLPDDRDGVDFDLGTENLSETRAKAVYEYLVKNGIAASRLSYKGFGHSRPLAPYPETTEEEKTLNRRVEIRIIHK